MTTRFRAIAGVSPVGTTGSLHAASPKAVGMSFARTRWIFRLTIFGLGVGTASSLIAIKRRCTLWKIYFSISLCRMERGGCRTRCLKAGLASGSCVYPKQHGAIESLPHLRHALRTTSDSHSNAEFLFRLSSPCRLRSSSGRKHSPALEALIAVLSHLHCRATINQKMQGVITNTLSIYLWTRTEIDRVC